MLALIIAGMVISLICLAIFRSLVHLRKQAEQAFQNLRKALDKRNRLIPRLIDNVQGTMRQEAPILKDLKHYNNTILQDPLLPHQQLERNQQLAFNLAKVQKSVKKYPNLWSSQQFRQVQSFLEEAEEELMAARVYYNGAVTALNQAIDTFPTNLMAKFARVKHRPILEAPAPNSTKAAMPELSKA